MEFRLILKKIDNTLNKEERKTFDAWYNESEEHRVYFEKVNQKYIKGLDVVDIENGWEAVSFRISKKGKRSTYFKYVAAAAIISTTAAFWFNSIETIEKKVLEHSVVVEQNQVEIGSAKAILTLEDGSKIALEEGESYKTDNASSNGEQLIYNGKHRSSEKTSTRNVLSIPRGGQFFVVLADGTKVWLNSETKLKYPVTFTPHNSREVELVFGEAYFEVSPSSNHNGTHFIVRTEGQTVDVVGTEFNIKSYKGDDNLSTTLVEGKVKVNNGSTSLNLTPGKQSLLRRETNKFSVSAVDVYDEVSWKNGFFSFKDHSLEDIMKVLSRWYDVEVIFQNESIKQLKFNGVFRKKQHIDEILGIIKGTNEVNYVVNKKTITMK